MAPATEFADPNDGVPTQHPLSAMANVPPQAEHDESIHAANIPLPPSSYAPSAKASKAPKPVWSTNHAKETVSYGNMPTAGGGAGNGPVSQAPPSTMANVPNAAPSVAPSAAPTAAPGGAPGGPLSAAPGGAPSVAPTATPANVPGGGPGGAPSAAPTAAAPASQANLPDAGGAGAGPAPPAPAKADGSAGSKKVLRWDTHLPNKDAQTPEPKGPK